MTSSNETADSTPIDVQSLRTRCLGDLAFVSELIGIFREQSLNTLAQLCQCASIGDRAGVTKWAHAMKGSAANLSADRLRAMCAELERSVGVISIAETQDRVSQITAEFGRCDAFFSVVLADLK
ncbi:hypothetical protein BH10PLA1_BH10PLA1_20090 [soil metagenome]